MGTIGYFAVFPVETFLALSFENSSSFSKTQNDKKNPENKKQKN